MTESEVAEITELIHTGQIYQLPREQLQQLFIKMNSPGSISGFGVSEREGFIKIINNALQSTKVPKPTPEPPTDRTAKENSKEKHWQNKIIIYIAVGVIIVVLGAISIHLLKRHFGIPL